MRTLLVCWCLQFIAVSAGAAAVQPSPSVVLENTSEGQMLSLTWPKAVTTKQRISGRELILSFSQPIERFDVQAIRGRLSSVVQYVEDGYDSLLLILREGIESRIATRSDGLDIHFRVVSAAQRSGEMEAFQLDSLRASVLYDGNRPLDAWNLLRKLNREQPENLETAVLFSQVEDQLGQGTSGLRHLEEALTTAIPAGDWPINQRQYLRKQYGDRAGISLNWRSQEEGGDDIVTKVSGTLVKNSGVSISGWAEQWRTTIDAVRRDDGRVEAFDGHRQRMALQLRKEWQIPQSTNGYLYAASRSGLGLGLDQNIGSNFGVSGLSLQINEPYYNLVKGIVGGASRDRLSLHHRGRMSRKLSGGIDLSYSRYNLSSISDAARAAGLKLDAQYRLKDTKPYISLNYNLFGRYVEETEERMDEFGDSFKPLPLSTVEIHSLGLSANGALPAGFQYAVAAGFSVDRYEHSEGALPYGSLSISYLHKNYLEMGVKASAYPNFNVGPDTYSYSTIAYITWHL